MLTRILSRAVPEVRVESATLTRAPTGHYWIRVEPDHGKYWRRFGRKYPHHKLVACARFVGEWDSVYYNCPEFCSKEALIDWLVDTLGLTQGERKLLRLSLL